MAPKSLQKNIVLLSMSLPLTQLSGTFLLLSVNLILFCTGCGVSTAQLCDAVHRPGVGAPYVLTICRPVPGERHMSQQSHAVH